MLCVADWMLGFILDSPPLGRLLPSVSACMPIYNPRANKSVDKTLIQEELERPGRSSFYRLSPSTLRHDHIW